MLKNKLIMDELKKKMETISLEIIDQENIINSDDTKSQYVMPSLNESIKNLTECRKIYTKTLKMNYYYENLPIFLEKYIERYNNIVKIKKKYSSNNYQNKLGSTEENF